MCNNLTLQQHFFILVLSDALNQALNRPSPPPPTIRITVGGIYFNDILMGLFVISQTPESNAVVQTSRSL